VCRAKPYRDNNNPMIHLLIYDDESIWRKSYLY
jgi:hypothetical protein